MRGHSIFILAFSFCLLFFAVANRADRASEEVIRDFRAVRVMIWGIDSNSGAVRGFAEAEVPPGKSATLNPDPATSFVWTNTEISGDVDPGISFNLRCAQMSFNNTQSLLRPSVVPVFRSVDTTVLYPVLSIPLGSIKSSAIAKLSQAKLRGDKADLESMFIAFARDKQLDSETLMWACSVLTTSHQLPEWIRLAEDRDFDVAALGLAAAARLGDAASLDRFCDRCIAAKGLTEQIPLANLLMEMPKNQRVLDVMLSMAALPDSLVYPGAACMDTRVELAERVQKSYPSEEIHIRADAFIAKAAALGDSELANRLKDVVGRIDRFADAQRTRPQPIEGVSLEERMRLRRNEKAATQPALGQ